MAATWRRIRARVPAFKRHLQDYGSVQLDRARLGLRRTAMRIVTIALVATAAAATTITAGILLATGIADGLTALCGGRAWLGNTLAGVGILGALLATLAVAYELRCRRDRKRLVRRYQSKQEDATSPQPHFEPEAQPPEI